MADSSSRRDPPESWRVCRGPANWFTFRCPEEVDVFQNQTLIELRRQVPSHKADESREAERPALLSMVAWWDESSSEDGHRHTPDLSLLFPQVVSLHPQPPLPTIVRNEVWSGISRRPRSGCWLARVFGRRPHYQWRLWTFRHGRLTIVATVQSADRRPLSADQLALCEAVLVSLEVADQPAWPPDIFLKQVLELARQHFPLLQASAARGFSVKLGHSEIGLSNFYRMYLQQPDQFRRIMLPGLTSVVRLQELSPQQLVPTLEEVRTRILPMLSADDDQRNDERIRTPWVGGLSIGYVVDEDDSYRYVQGQMLQTWSISHDELHDIAIENLQRYSSDNPLEVTVMGDEDTPRMMMPVKPDAYNCSRILDPQFHSRLRSMFGPEFVVGVPNRDFFVAVSLKEKDLIEQVRNRVKDDFSTMHHPLTRRLLLVSADGVSEFCEA